MRCFNRHIAILGYKKWFLNLSAKVQKKNVKKERFGGYYGKKSVII